MTKVLVPDMPTADDLLPYLRRIDAARWYSNHGPLVQELQHRLTREVVRNPCAVVANGTAAIELALRAMHLPPGAGVLVPAVTFVATGLAIINAGLRPVLADVDPVTWQLTPAAAHDAVRAHDLVAVLPVAAFGSPCSVAAWAGFAATTGTQVLIDAAGAIYDQHPSDSHRVTIAYSMHATKALGAGEGGVVAGPDTALLERVEKLAAFGIGGTNAKLSEYHAAVALASMDRSGWSSWRAALAKAYEVHMPARVAMQIGARQTMRTLMPVLLPAGADAGEVAQAMHAMGIETRRWYHPFLLGRRQFMHAASPLPVSAELEKRLIGLPFHSGVLPSDAGEICAALAEALRANT